MSKSQICLGGGGLDRHSDLRPDADWLWRDGAARIVPFWRGRVLIAGEGRGRLVTLERTDPLVEAHAKARAYLGDAGAGPLFAVDVSQWQPASAQNLGAGPGRVDDDQPVGRVGSHSDARFADFRGLIAVLDPLEAEIAATGKGILEWHRSHGFCARCGAPSAMADGGWRRVCGSCGTSHFPRTDPVVIMLVSHGNSVLIGRSPGWPEGFYSLLAGFMEPGETVAGAVRREVAEEAGVRVGPVRLVESQPWPFPASLMIGCFAQAETTDITIDRQELDDALWLSREMLLEVFAGQHPKIATPRSGAIAHHLMKMWLADKPI